MLVKIAENEPPPGILKTITEDGTVMKKKFLTNVRTNINRTQCRTKFLWRTTLLEDEDFGEMKEWLPRATSSQLNALGGA